MSDSPCCSLNASLPRCDTCVFRQHHSPTVAIVRRVGECDVREIPGMRMSYRDARAELATLPASQLRHFDLVYVNCDGTLGRFASWAL